MMSDAEKTLNTLANGGSAVDLADGTQVIVAVCSGRVLPKVLRFVSTVSTDLELTIDDAQGIKDKLLSKMNNVGFLLQLIAKYTDDVYELLASLTDLGSKDKVADLALDDLAKVAVRVVEVNKDFFTNRVLPVLNAAGGTAL